VNSERVERDSARLTQHTKKNTPQKGARTNARGQVGDTSRERCGSLTRAECSRANDLAAVRGEWVQSRCVLEGVGEEEEGRRWESERESKHRNTLAYSTTPEGGGAVVHTHM
jgi:hypothetical protein